MKKKLFASWILFAVMGLLAAGCNKDNGSGPVDEQPPDGVTDEISAMKYFVLNDEFVANDEETMNDHDLQPTDYGDVGKVQADITPLRWGRFITQVTRTVTDTVQPGDSVTVVHVHKDITGLLKIMAIDINGDTVLIEKPFVDQSDRNVIFKRIARDPRRFWRNWLPVATSLVDGGSTNNLIDITRLQLFTGDGDSLTITDPLAFYLRYRWRHMFVRTAERDIPELSGGETVTIQATVLSTSPDTDIVALRFGCDRLYRWRARMNLVSEIDNGNGTYTRVYEKTWDAHVHAGYFHAVVVALTKATLFDDAAPYSANWWGVPYRVF